MHSKLQKHDKRITDTQDREIKERRHWTGVVSMCPDKYECLLMEKDVEIGDSSVHSVKGCYDIQAVTGVAIFDAINEE